MKRCAGGPGLIFLSVAGEEVRSEADRTAWARPGTIRATQDGVRAAVGPMAEEALGQRNGWDIARPGCGPPNRA